jgi:hypothetical protein
VRSAKPLSAFGKVATFTPEHGFLHFVWLQLTNLHFASKIGTADQMILALALGMTNLGPQRVNSLMEILRGVGADLSINH